MAGKRGRPAKTDTMQDARQQLIDAAVRLIKKTGADSVTVRSVCEEADLSIGTFYHHLQNKDDLMMYFIREESFDTFSLQTPLSMYPDRIFELYMYLLHRYMELGKDFMKSFYTTGNQALSAYLGVADGRFADGTVMARCETETIQAIEQGILRPDADAHQISADICTIVKGTVFEWCLEDGNMDLEGTLLRILQSYCTPYCKRETTVF